MYIVDICYILLKCKLYEQMFTEKIIPITVISEPDDVTICEGGRTVFAYVLNSNIGNDVQWYRYIMDTGTTEIVYPSRRNVYISTHTGNTINSSLTITNARRFYTGYYWVGTRYYNVCNVSLTVTVSM